MTLLGQTAGTTTSRVSVFSGDPASVSPEAPPLDEGAAASEYIAPPDSGVVIASPARPSAPSQLNIHLQDMARPVFGDLPAIEGALRLALGEVPAEEIFIPSALLFFRTGQPVTLESLVSLFLRSSDGSRAKKAADGSHPGQRSADFLPWLREKLSVVPVAKKTGERTTFHIELPQPARKDLAALERVLARIAELWPRKDGRFDSSMTKITPRMCIPVIFSDGRKLMLETLLIRHRALLLKELKAGDFSIKGIPAVALSRDYLVFALKRVTGDDSISFTGFHSAPSDVIEINVPNIASWRGREELEMLLKAVWRKKNFESDGIKHFYVRNSNGEQKRLYQILRAYWKILRPELIASGTISPATPKDSGREDVLDIIYFHLFDRVRKNVRWNRPKRYLRIQFPNAKLSSRTDTIEEMFAILYSIAKNRIVAAHGSFPVDHSRNLVFYFPNGLYIYYFVFMVKLNSMIAKLIGNNDARLFDVPINERYIQRPEIARVFPSPKVREKLYELATRYKGSLPPKRPVAHVTRRRGGEEKSILSPSRRSR